MTSRFLATMLLALSLAVAGPAMATPIFTAELTGDQEVPPVDTPATGFTSVSLDEEAFEITVSLFFSGLTTPQTVAHIHGPAAPGVNAPPIVPFPVGTFTDMVFPVTQQQADWIKQGLTYANVHSERYPAGEIRGQLEPIPEPGTVLLFASGLALLALGRFKKRTA